MTTTSVTLSGVTRRFGATTVLDDVDLGFGPGVTGLLGPNGAGKTTLLRILATVLAPTAGTVRLLGRDPGDVTARTEVRRRLGYLPQANGFPRGFTAFRFVDYLAVLKEWTETGARHAEVRRVLGLVGLGDQATSRLRRLSGGQQRRVALAQALIGDPDLLVLDEPTTGLDPEQRASLRGVLSAAGRRSTVLLATHQTEDIAALCERVIVLDGGRVRYDGSVADLVGSAVGKVWLADEPSPDSLSSWRTGTGRFRMVGQHAPVGTELAEPTVEDAYLLLRGTKAEPAVTS
ncbi:ATP-binding cassette domain-containing protein [Georgenia subflava]|uniref:ATP-binding cassette domain-containing protein n=1 Tax=Georgenia subflava TaxID=1622177 RepID=A0A6N7EGU9_9MICO|nr:ATP-binding cassette domain-containing protein [Georgenia subflava]MPV37359.1 ATP-binding cassette domain-containing protein [Georgenia subflava]